MKREIKVLFIVVSKVGQQDHSSVTGPERRMANMLPFWKNLGVEPVFCYPSNGRLRKTFESSGYKSYDFQTKSKFDFGAVKRIRAIIRKEQIELIHTQGAAATDLFASIAARLENKKMVITRPVMISDQVHYSKGKRSAYFLLDKYITMRLAHKIISVSELGSQTLRRQYRLSPDKVKVIYNGVDLQRFNHHPKPDEELRVGMVAHLSVFKGWFDFLEVISGLRKRMPNITACIIGDGVLRQELEKRVEELSLNNVVEFRGACDNVSEELNRLDLMLFTSHREGLSVAVLEALASGLPVVASNIGGINEQVENEVNGYVCGMGDIETMIKKCEEILSNTEKRKQFALSSRQIAQERFDENAMVEGYAKVYFSFFE